MGENQTHTAVVVATQVALLERLVVEAGYEVVAAAESGVNGEHLLRHFTPDVVVVEHDLVGPTGYDSLSGLHTASPATKALLVVSDDWRPRDVGSIGACAVVTMHRLGELVAELDGLGDWIDSNSGSPIDAERRTGRDRRVHQDWTKVGWERRDGERRAA
ncbi:MAG: hypothetical protein AAF548_08495 [Actinomycetota bacterium]